MTFLKDKTEWLWILTGCDNSNDSSSYLLCLCCESGIRLSMYFHSSLCARCRSHFAVEETGTQGEGARPRPCSEWWKQDSNPWSLVPENLAPGCCFAILAHESLPLASRLAIETLTWRSVFEGTSKGLMRYCQTCSFFWGPWRTARHRSARRSWRKCTARYVS